jgi:hypothetical protein
MKTPPSSGVFVCGGPRQRPERRPHALQRVIQNFLDDVRHDAEVGESRCKRAAQVVRRERRLDFLALAPAPQPRLHAGIRSRWRARASTIRCRCSTISGLRSQVPE